MSNTYKLQLCHGDENKNFITRDAVLDYINGQLQYGGVSLLPYEPVLFFYGEDDNKNAIIMVGLPEGKTQSGKSFFIIDTADLKESIESIDKNYDDAIKALQEEDEKISEVVNQEIEDRKAAGEKEAKAREDKDIELETEIAEEVETLSKKDNELQEAIDFTKADLMSVINACGLIYNEKLAEDRVSYIPDTHNEVIRDAKDIAEAIDKISNFVIQLGNDLKLSVDNTDTVSLSLSANTKDGENTLTADVNIAGAEGLSKKNYDNNIIGKTGEGLYVCASIEPSAKNPNILVFKTSGYIDGQFKVDAFETEVQLTPYKGDNGKNTGITVSVDTDKNVISSELNIASDDTNILKLEDGEYIVEGTAKNIKYKDTNVFTALNNQSTRIEEIEDSIEFVKSFEVKGSETDSTSVSVDKTTKGDFTVSTDVKLSTDKSIIVSNGGLKANISATFKKGTSTLLIEVGNNEYAIDLSGLAVSVLKTATYDADTEELVLEFIVGDTTKTVRIPVGTLIHDVEVDDSDTIDLTLKSVSGGPNHISAELKVDKAHSDNMLTVSSNGAYVSKAFITDAVKVETDERKAADKELETKIDETTKLANANKEAITAEATTARAAEKANADAIAQEIKDARAAEDTNARAIEKNANNIKENQTAIGDEVTRATKAEQINATAITAEETRAKEAEVKNANAIASEIDRAMEKEADLLEKIGDNTSKIKENTTAIETETERATKADNEIKAAVEATSASVVTEVERAKTAENELANKISKNTEELASAKELVNNVDKALETEVTRAKAAEAANATAIEAEKNRAEVKEGELAGNITSVQNDVAKAIDNISANKNAIDSEIARAKETETNNANNIANEVTRAKEKEKELSEKIANNANGISANQTAINDEVLRATTTEDNLKLSITKAESSITSVKENLESKINEEALRAKDAESAIQNQIETLSKNAEKSSSDLQLAKDELNAKIDKKANIADVYTKDEILTKFDDYALEADVKDSLNEKLNVTDAQNVYATKEALQVVKDTYATTETVKDLNSQATKRISDNEEAIDNFNLTYNAATSELIYTNKNGVSNTYKLYSGSLVKKGEFDTDSNSIVLTIENAGIESQITIPVSQLLSDVSEKIQGNTDAIQKINEALSKLAKDWEVKATSSVELTKTSGAEKDVLTAMVRVATSNKQAIQSTGDGLYVSNDLEDFTCVYGEDGTISAQTAISKLLTKTQNSDNEINNLNTDLTELKDQVKENTSALNKATSDVSSLVDQVKENTANIANKANASDVYTKTEITEKLNDYVKVSNVYTKDEITTKLNDYAKTTDVYTKTEVDNTLSEYAKTTDLQTKLDEKLSKTDAETTYATKDSVEETIKAFEQIKNYIDNITDMFDKLKESGIEDIAEEFAKIKKATGYDTYESEKNLPTRVEALEEEDTNIKTNLIGDKDNPTEGSVWYELNNIVDAGTF